jgi:hypothetical protein
VPSTALCTPLSTSRSIGALTASARSESKCSRPRPTRFAYRRKSSGPSRSWLRKRTSCISAEHARGGECIRLPDDGAERQRGRPAQTGDRRMHHRPDNDHREDHETDRQADQSAAVRPQIPDRRFGRRAEEQRGQEHEKDEVRLELDARQTGNERQAQTTQHEQRRIGHSEAAGDLEQDRDGDKDRQNGGQNIHGRSPILTHTLLSLAQEPCSPGLSRPSVRRGGFGRKVNASLPEGQDGCAEAARRSAHRDE